MILHRRNFAGGAWAVEAKNSNAIEGLALSSRLVKFYQQFQQNEKVQAKRINTTLPRLFLFFY